MTILDQFGPIVRQEFEAADERYRLEILEWLATLAPMSDEELQAEAEYRIYDSASSQRFRGNWEHIHVKATACYDESVRRLLAQGHGRFCSAPSVYGRAYNAVMRSHGYAERPEGKCNCEQAKEKT